MVVHIPDNIPNYKDWEQVKDSLIIKLYNHPNLTIRVVVAGDGIKIWAHDGKLRLGDDIVDVILTEFKKHSIKIYSWLHRDNYTLFEFYEKKKTDKKTFGEAMQVASSILADAPRLS